MNIRTWTFIFLAVFCSGCAMIPHYERPDFAAPRSWDDLPGYPTPEGEQAAARLSWRAFFTNEAIEQVIGAVLEHNQDLRLAALRIEEERALYRITRSDLLPGVDANLKAGYAHSSDEGDISGKARRTDSFEANAGVDDYEFDLFGRVRSLSRSAQNEFFASREAEQAVHHALVAEAAQAYLQLLADGKLLDLTEKTLEAQMRSYDILTKIRQEGVATQQDVARAQTTVETARVNSHRYRRLVAQDKNALVLLIGTPDAKDLIPEASLDDLHLPKTLPVGLPSEVLLMRPDIRQAEYELMARNADIGAARAAFFPEITLTGDYGFASRDLSELFSGGALGAWSFAPKLVMPLFDGGRHKAGLDLARIRKEEAVVQYEQAIQKAFREVADALAARATLEEELKSQQRLVAAASQVYEASEARYKSGLDSYLSVLDAQRALYQAEQDEIEIERQRLSNLVTLYKAMGGGADDIE